MCYSNLTEDEKNALSDHIPGDYDINLYLRSSYLKQDEEIEKRIRLLDSAINKLKIMHSDLVYRGTRASEIEDNIIMYITYSQEFPSCSYSIDEAKKFINKQESTILKIHTKAGQRGAVLQPKCDWAKKEREVLLPRKSVFLIKNQYKTSDVDQIEKMIGPTDLSSLNSYTLICIKNKYVNNVLLKIIIFVKWIKSKFK